MPKQKMHRQRIDLASRLAYSLDPQRVVFSGVPKTNFIYDEAAERFTLSGKTFYAAQNRIVELEAGLTTITRYNNYLQTKIDELSKKSFKKYTEVQYEQMLDKLETEALGLRKSLAALREENAFLEKRSLQHSSETEKVVQQLKASKSNEARAAEEIARRCESERLFERQFAQQAEQFGTEIAKLHGEKKALQDAFAVDCRYTKEKIEYYCQNARTMAEKVATAEYEVREAKAGLQWEREQSELLARKIRQQNLGIDSLRHKYAVLEYLRASCDNCVKGTRNFTDLFTFDSKAFFSCLYQLDVAPALIRRIFEAQDVYRRRSDEAAIYSTEALKIVLESTRNQLYQAYDRHRIANAENQLLLLRIDDLKKYFSDARADYETAKEENERLRRTLAERNELIESLALDFRKNAVK